MSSVRFVFWDVQHGSATYLRTPNNKHFVFDLGTGSYKGGNITFSPLLHLKRDYGINKLDAVIITHPHRDHLDDIFNVSQFMSSWSTNIQFAFARPRHLNETEIRAGNRETDKSIIDGYLMLDKNSTIDIPTALDPFLPFNNGGIKIKLFSPRNCATSNLNNHSLVAVINYSGLKMIIPGDNESCSWNELLIDNEFVELTENIDVLLAPHHGRESGFHLDAISHFNPRLTIVSDGRFCDTNARDRYSSKSRGWKVHKRSGGSEDRRCLTTGSTGVIVVDFGTNNGNNYIYVEIN